VRHRPQHKAPPRRRFGRPCDTWLSQRPYLLGSAFSLADLILGSVVRYGTFCGVPVTGHTHLQRWLEGVTSRPSMQNPLA
jgi:glutathione S-transferase